MLNLFPVLRSKFNEVDRPESIFDKWLDNFFFSDFTVTPAFDINETSDSFILSGELAGVKPEDVHITLDDGILTVKGEKKKEIEESQYSERSYGSFQRSWNFGNRINIDDNIDATFKDGILKITIPKVSKENKRTVEIKTK